MRGKWAYYNEFDPNNAEWIRQLIKLGEIPDGEVDERSVVDVRAEDLRGFVRCGFFAGVAGWDLALRRAGWPDDLPVWTGSCPCQPFSSAGKQKGVDDHRDLWPVFYRLIAECRPERVFGEQVAAAIKHGWLDRLHTDLEASGYAVGASVLGAHSAGAPHIRQRLYWLADRGLANTDRPERRAFCLDRQDGREGKDVGREATHSEFGTRSEIHGLADADSDGCDKGRARDPKKERDGAVRDSPALRLGNPAGDNKRRNTVPGEHRQGLASGGSDGVCGMGDTEREGLEGFGRPEQQHVPKERGGENGQAPLSGSAFAFWGNAERLYCRDEKTRLAQPGVAPLVDVVRRNMGCGGDSRVQMPNVPPTVETVNATGEARIMRLKGYGNALCVETARMFVEAGMEVMDVGT